MHAVRGPWVALVLGAALGAACGVEQEGEATGSSGGSSGAGGSGAAGGATGGSAGTGATAGSAGAGGSAGSGGSAGGGGSGGASGGGAGADAASGGSAGDAGSDAPVDVPVDVSLDAPADASVDANPPDVGSDVVSCTPSYLLCNGSCASVLNATTQLDAASVLSHDVVKNGSDPTQNAMDASSYVLMTAAFAGAGFAGLPNDGFFAATAGHPAVQLPISNGNDGNNARILTAGQTLTLSVPAAVYPKLFLWITATEGDAATQVTLHYCDNTTGARSFDTPDWFDDPPPTGFVSLINGLDRFSLGNNTKNSVKDPAILGYDLAPSSTKVLTSIDVKNASGGSQRLVFFGATGGT